MSAIRAHREATGVRHSATVHVVSAAARTIAAHPAANAAIRGRHFPRVRRYPDTYAKITFDRTLDGERIVLSSVLAEPERRSLDEIQAWLHRLRDGDPARLPEFAPARALQR